MYVHCSHQGHAWLKDDEATQCKQCQKEFSIARRKVGSHLIPFSLYFYSLHLHNNVSKLSMFVCCSITAGTVVTSTATTVPVMSWPYPPTLGQCGCAICATPSCCREAPPRVPDITPTSFKVSTRAFQHCTYSSMIFNYLC